MTMSHPNKKKKKKVKTKAIQTNSSDDPNLESDVKSFTLTGTTWPCLTPDVCDLSTTELKRISCSIKPTYSYMLKKKPMIVEREEIAVPKNKLSFVSRFKKNTEKHSVEKHMKKKREAKNVTCKEIPTRYPTIKSFKYCDRTPVVYQKTKKKKYPGKYMSQPGSLRQYNYHHKEDESTFHLVTNQRRRNRQGVHGRQRGGYNDRKGQVGILNKWSKRKNQAPIENRDGSASVQPGCVTNEDGEDVYNDRKKFDTRKKRSKKRWRKWWKTKKQARVKNLFFRPKWFPIVHREDIYNYRIGRVATYREALINIQPNWVTIQNREDIYNHRKGIRNKYSKQKNQAPIVNQDGSVTCRLKMTIWEMGFPCLTKLLPSNAEDGEDINNDCKGQVDTRNECSEPENQTPIENRDTSVTERPNWVTNEDGEDIYDDCKGQVGTRNECSKPENQTPIENQDASVTVRPDWVTNEDGQDIYDDCKGQEGTRNECSKPENQTPIENQDASVTVRPDWVTNEDGQDMYNDCKGQFGTRKKCSRNREKKKKQAPIKNQDGPVTSCHYPSSSFSFKKMDIPCLTKLSLSHVKGGEHIYDDCKGQVDTRKKCSKPENQTPIENQDASVSVRPDWVTNQDGQDMYNDCKGQVGTRKKCSRNREKKKKQAPIKNQNGPVTSCHYPSSSFSFKKMDIPCLTKLSLSNVKGGDDIYDDCKGQEGTHNECSKPENQAPIENQDTSVTVRPEWVTNEDGQDMYNDWKGQAGTRKKCSRNREKKKKQAPIKNQDGPVTSCHYPTSSFSFNKMDIPCLTKLSLSNVKGREDIYDDCKGQVGTRNECMPENQTPIENQDASVSVRPDWVTNEDGQDMYNDCKGQVGTRKKCSRHREKKKKQAHIKNQDGTVTSCHYPSPSFSFNNMDIPCLTKLSLSNVKGRKHIYDDCKGQEGTRNECSKPENQTPIENQDASVTVRPDWVNNEDGHDMDNAVRIHGVPLQPNEDIMGIVKAVGTAMNMEVNEAMIDACHRLGNKPGRNNVPPGIIVKFVRRLDKEEFLRKRRAKRDLSTRHMNMAMDQAVYVDEALTLARRKLLAAARQVRRVKNFRHLWVRNGKIFLRKEDRSTIIQVTCQADLDKIV